MDELVAGKYRVGKMIGQGGMGAVWEARHVELGTRVACKFIDAEFATKSPEAVSRFRNEAKAAASLHTKYVVDIYDYGTMSDGRPYIVMEYLEGESLEDRLERIGRMPLQATYRLIHQVGRALQKAHRNGIVHRDLKPDNIFIIWDEEDQVDQVKVVDFGIAKFTDDQAGVSHATATGSILGTPFYMSPEQARGKTDIDLRADLWSLGVVAFQCLTGELPFFSDAVGDLLVEICTGEIPVPSHVAPDLPAPIDAWMARALTRDKDLRFQSAREMTEALGEALGPGMRPQMASLFDDSTGVGMGGAVRQGQTYLEQPAGKVTTGGLSTMSADVTLAAPPISQVAVGWRRYKAQAIAAGVLVLGVAIGILAVGSGDQADETVVEADVLNLDGPGKNMDFSKGVPAASPAEAEKSVAPKVEKASAGDEGVATLDSLPFEKDEQDAEAAKKQPATTATPAPAPAPAPAPKKPTTRSRDVGLGY